MTKGRADRVERPPGPPQRPVRLDEFGLPGHHFVLHTLPRPMFVSECGMTIARRGRRHYFPLIGAKKPQEAIRMEFGGRYLFEAPRPLVWAALNDAAMLRAAIPGCHRLDWLDENRLALEIKVNLGVVHPVFSGDLTLSNIVPAQSYTLAGRGRGGLLGLAHGAADITLADQGPGTELVFAAEGGASGQLMRLGRGLIGSSAQRVVDGFFERFAAAMGVPLTPLQP
jgi:carbon monoxide dehydrogenase subunit G